MSGDVTAAVADQVSDAMNRARMRQARWLDAREPGSMTSDLGVLADEIERLRAEVVNLRRSVESAHEHEEAEAQESARLRAEWEALHSDETRSRLLLAVWEASGSQHSEQIVDAALSVLTAGSEATR